MHTYIHTTPDEVVSLGTYKGSERVASLKLDQKPPIGVHHERERERERERETEREREREHIHTYTHTYIHAYVYTYIHTHIHTHILIFTPRQTRW
jgi:hypothetical protein